MHRMVGDLKADEDGLALRGVLARHLVMHPSSFKGPLLAQTYQEWPRQP